MSRPTLETGVIICGTTGKQITYNVVPLPDNVRWISSIDQTNFILNLNFLNDFKIEFEIED